MLTSRESTQGALVVQFLVTMIDMIGFGIIIPFLTYLVQDLAEGQDTVSVGLWVGLLMTAYSAAQFLFSPFWGTLSDRIGRRPVLMIGLVGNTVFFLAFGFSKTLLFALAMRFLITLEGLVRPPEMPRPRLPTLMPKPSQIANTNAQTQDAYTHAQTQVAHAHA